MIELNPFILHKDRPQHVSWGHLKNKTIYNLEIILPFKGIITQYQDKGYYLCLCVRVADDQKLNVSELIKDQLVLVDFPIKTFERAWVGINHIFRNQITEKDNVKLTFEKKSKQAIQILTYERMVPSSEQIKFADKYYVEYNRVVKPVIRRREEL